MRERPILFSAPMVHSILEGRKTQTRRMLKPQPQAQHWTPERESYIMTPTIEQGGLITYAEFPYTMGEVEQFPCPYGQPGDRLWVREAWATYPIPWNEFKIEDLPIDLRDKNPVCEIFYKADGSKAYISRWRPSIHMPRRASRILLEITGIRVERLLDTSHEDAIAEGCSGQGWKVVDPRHPVIYPAIEYKALWESINGRGSWNVNPWVWVIEFRRVEQ